MPFEIIEHKYTKFTVNFLIATLFTILFFTCAFFSYTKDVERSIVINNINYTIEDILNRFKQLIPTMGKKLLPNQFEDDKINYNNSKLIYKFIKLYGAILIISFILAYIISKHYNINFQDILISNIILLVAITTTVYFFFNDIIVIDLNKNKICN
jgi:hypothetical protein